MSISEKHRLQREGYNLAKMKDDRRAWNFPNHMQSTDRWGSSRVGPIHSRRKVTRMTVSEENGFNIKGMSWEN